MSPVFVRVSGDEDIAVKPAGEARLGPGGTIDPDLRRASPNTNGGPDSQDTRSRLLVRGSKDAQGALSENPPRTRCRGHPFQSRSRFQRHL